MKPSFGLCSPLLWGGGGGGAGQGGPRTQGRVYGVILAFPAFPQKPGQKCPKRFVKADTSKKEFFSCSMLRGGVLCSCYPALSRSIPCQVKASAAARRSRQVLCFAHEKKRVRTYSWMKAGSTISPHFGLVILFLLHTKGSAIYLHPGVAMCNVCFTPLICREDPCLGFLVWRPKFIERF